LENDVDKADVSFENNQLIIACLAEELKSLI
jgi:hypothetical protein